MPFPMLLGHEGAGIVEQVGDGRRGSAARRSRGPVVGRPVRHLPVVHPRGSLGAAPTRGSSHPGSGGPATARRSPGVLACGTLATRTVVHAAQAIPLPDGIPLDRACLLGCGVSTGVGAAIQTAKVWPGATVAVIGLGGIGLSAMQGAKIAGAERLIAIDIAPTKLGWATAFGATDVVDASAVDAVTAVRDLTGGEGVDVAFEATGVPSCVRQAVEMLAYAGTAVAIGVPPIPSEVAPPVERLRRCRVSAQGEPAHHGRRGSHPRRGLPADGRLVPRRTARPRRTWSPARSVSTSSTRRSAPCSPARSSVPSSGSTTSDGAGVASAACERPSSTRGGRSCRPSPTSSMRVVFRVRVEGDGERAGEGAGDHRVQPRQRDRRSGASASWSRGDAGGESRFLVAAEVFDKRMPGWILRSFDQIPIRRGQGDVDALDEAIHTVKAGAIAAIAPEGRVNEDGATEMLRFHRGVARLALATGAPVVPVGIWGTQARWPRSGRRYGKPWRPRLAFVFGEIAARRRRSERRRRPRRVHATRQRGDRGAGRTAHARSRRSG